MTVANRKYDELKTKVRPRLNKILASKRMVQRDLEKRSGVTQASISRFDKSSRFEIAHLIAIKEALGLNSIDELFEIEA